LGEQGDLQEKTHTDLINVKKGEISILSAGGMDGHDLQGEKMRKSKEEKNVRYKKPTAT